jgi:hypothetical protein
MRQLGEQWVEVIDGEEHMVKCVERHSEQTYDCSGCFYNNNTGKCLYGQDCPIADVEHGYIRDLGILKNGILPEERTGEYPKLRFVKAYVQYVRKIKGKVWRTL